MKPWSVLLADDQPLIIEGLRQILTSREFQIAGAVADGRAALGAAVELQPDLLICGINLPLLNGVEAARQISKQCPNTRIIFFTMREDLATALRAIDAGAKGYIIKTARTEQVLEAIHSVLRNQLYITPSLEKAVLESLRRSRGGGSGLTGRQREILQLLSEGKPPKEIAAILQISPRTVEFHKYRILERLGIASLPELIAWAAKNDVL